MKRFLPALLVAILLVCVSTAVYAIIHCNKNPRAAACSETSNYEDDGSGEQADGDCDEGDKYEARPDPDCNGIWYGTPAPNSVRTPSKTVTSKTQPNKGNTINTKVRK